MKNDPIGLLMSLIITVIVVWGFILGIGFMEKEYKNQEYREERTKVVWEDQSQVCIEKKLKDSWEITKYCLNK